jgi:glutamine amidotransferase/cyclase
MQAPVASPRRAPLCRPLRRRCGAPLASPPACRRASRRAAPPCAAAASSDKDCWLLDYGAGNVRSVRNAIRHLGYTVRDVQGPEDIARANRLLFPGVGAFGTAMEVLTAKGYVGPLKEYIQARTRTAPAVLCCVCVCVCAGGESCVRSQP